ncbi:hypothetical protein, partial [Pannonibacter tanglangensis]|uniref:hypothetical protein n=1 Tax=Pannonibacter tanglangensis TaxID=2750084 RepID=UPI001AD8CF52
AFSRNFGAQGPVASDVAAVDEPAYRGPNPNPSIDNFEKVRASQKILHPACGQAPAINRTEH